MFETMTRVEELQSLYSDFHKDVYGFRPRSMSTENWNSEAWLEGVIADLHASLDARKDTFAGREGLRADGWQIPETDPVYIQQAMWLQQERDREHKEWMASF